MRLFKYSALLLSAFLMFVSCKKEELVPDNSVSNNQNAALKSGQMDGDVIPGKYIVVYKSNDASMPNLSSIPSYEAKVKVLKDHSSKFLTKHGISENVIGETYVSSLTAFVADLSEVEAEKLRKDPSVAYIEQDRIVNLELPTVSGISAEATQVIPWGVAKVGSASGAGKTAWIIDTGIDFSHPALVLDATKSKSFLGPGTNPQEIRNWRNSQNGC